MTDSSRPQWAEADGSHGALQSAINSARVHLDEAQRLPEILYAEAPGPYALRALSELRDATAWLDWAQRVIVDQALHDHSAPQRDLATAAGVSLTTVQRWAKRPAVIGDDGSFGPGTLPDSRRTR